MSRPSATAVELRLWAGSLEGLARDIERGVDQVGDKWDESFARAVGERLANVERLLKQARLEAQEAVEIKEALEDLRRPR